MVMSMAETKRKTHSYSALSTYESCTLKYDLSYMRGIWLPKIYSYELVKGLIFHGYAELYKSTKEFANHRYLIDYAFTHADDVSPEWLGKLTLEERQTIINACKEFKEWWDKKFYSSLYAPDEPVDEFFKIHRETKLYGDEPFPFNGVLDLYYEDDKGLHIIDYKTPKNAKIDTYRSQLELYAYFLGKKEDKPVSSISVYFAFAKDVKNGDRVYPVPLTRIPKTVEKYSALVTEITGPNRKAEATLNWLCDYCPYRGRQEYCPVSVIAGAKPQPQA